MMCLFSFNVACGLRGQEATYPTICLRAPPPKNKIIPYKGTIGMIIVNFLGALKQMVVSVRTLGSPVSGNPIQGLSSPSHVNPKQANPQPEYWALEYHTLILFS